MARPKSKSPEPAASPSAATIPAAPMPAQLGDALPAWLQRVTWLGWLRVLSGEQRVGLALLALAALLFVPWLGATGLWDPWEPHYGEVAREMIARGDYLHSWWESGYFFSKPALDLWLMAAGMLAVGANDAGRALGVYTEWGVRLPFASISALGAILLFFAANRLVGRRPAILAVIAILTAPLTTLLTRQAVPDPIFVGLLTAAMACLLIVLFEREDLGPTVSGRDGWLVAFYVLVGLATLSKGLLGFAIPGAVALVYCVVTGERYRLRRLRLLLGAVIVLAICAPWYGTMFAFDGRDDEGKTFFERFILHDHFKRLVSGVHTTTPGGSFTYFIEQLGFDCFPWVLAFPGAAAVVAKTSVRPGTQRERALLFTLIWALIGFAVFAFSATKFHHYAFPVIPPLMVLCAVWLDQVLDEGLRAHAGELLVGGLLYALIAHNFAMQPKHLTDLFVYNYDRPYPDRETDPRQTFTLLFYAAPAVALSPWVFDRLSQLWTFVRAWLSKSKRAAARAALAGRLDGAPLTTPESRQDRTLLVLTLMTLAVCFSIFLGWFQWRRWSVHWTQRDLFWAYYQDSSPDEPVAAFQMNWRGETFYSKNTVRQLSRSTPPMTTLPEFLNGPGKRKWVLSEQARIAALRQTAGTNWRVRVVESKHNKFALTVIEPAPAPPPATQTPAPTPQPQGPQQIGPMN
jgi:4-amino-4-deoxy-L-arabinose transferase-like glycosyltransferase